MLQFLPSGRLSAGFETITPENAAELLVGDVRTRPVSQVRVAQLERDMAANAWRINGEALVFSPAGKLLDGRKRLLACVASGVPFTTLVVHGVDESACISLDSRKTRALGDILTAGGHEHGRTLNTELKFIGHMCGGTWNVRSYKNSVLLTLLRTHPEIVDFLRSSMRPGRKCSPAMHGAVHFTLSRIDAAQADEFFDAVYDPDGHALSARDPRRLLAKRLADVAARKVQMGLPALAAMFFHAWNGWQTNVKGLTVPKDGDPFPAIEFWEDSFAIDMDALASDREATVHAEDSAEGLQVHVQHVDPELAALWLEQNTSNRKISPGTVGRYSRDMTAGKWKLTGETVKFGRNGRLLDGQHRLQAVVRSGETVTMLVVEGLDETVFDTIDTGQRQGFPGFLSELGRRQTTTLAAALKVVLCIELNYDLRSFLPTNEELNDVLTRHPGIVDCLRDATIPSLDPGLAVATSYLFRSSDQEKAEEFFQKVRGIGTFDKSDPVLQLRHKLGSGRNGSKAGGSTPSGVLQLLIAAWNAFCQGRRTLRQGAASVAGRPFPVIV